jgi:hypothetical protein
MYVHRCMIVPVAYAELARSLAAGLAGTGGENMWITPLSASGMLPATHYISTGFIGAEFAVMMSDAQAIYDAASGTVPRATIEAMLAASDISEEEPFPAINRLGLKLVQADV